jgi:serine/threonine protein kinase
MSDDELTGKQLGEYRLDALLGQGGMARVYRATDVRLKRQAVIKVIAPPSRNDPGYITRFEREAQIIGQLDHPNIVRLYRYDEQDGLLYMAMQHIEGADLGVVLANYRADKAFIEPDEARKVIREICSALDYAHRKGVIHRDVKPANILLDRQGRAFLSDFGLALITEIGTRGEIFGSAYYMAPEQAVSSAKAVPQSDLYAIGVILYEMFTGDVPFQAERPLDIAFLQITEPPTPPRQIRPEINPELEEVILKSLAKKPEERYQTGTELANALDAALQAKTASSLFGTNSPVTRQSIADRVALELGEQPLPLIPAVVAASPEPGIAQKAVTEESPDVPKQIAPDEQPLPLVPAAVATPIAPESTAKSFVEKPQSTLNKKPLIYTGLVASLGVIVLLVVICSGIFTFPSMLGSLQAAGNTLVATINGGTPEETDTPVKKPGVVGQETNFPSTQASATRPAPTETPSVKGHVTYTLLIVRSNDSVIVVNQSVRAFLLDVLSLGDETNGAVNGTEWGVAKLRKGECVGVWKQAGGKDKDKNKMPEGISCSLLGTRLVKDKKNWLGESSFGIYYKGKQFGICDKDQKQCLITITIP